MLFLVTHLLLCFLLMKCTVKHWQWCDVIWQGRCCLCETWHHKRVTDWQTCGEGKKQMTVGGLIHVIDTFTVPLTCADRKICARTPVRLFSCLDLTPEEQPNMWEWEISWIKSVQIFLFSLCGYISILLYKNMSSPPPFLLMYVVQQCEKAHAYIFSWHFLSLVLSFQPLGDIDSCSRCVSGRGVSLGKPQG